MEAKVNSSPIKIIAVVVFVMIVGFLLGASKDFIKTRINVPALFKTQSSSSLSPQALAQLLVNKDFTFINVHTPYEREIEKTDLFIPYNEIVANSNFLPQDKKQSIVLYCKTGRMSQEALETFQKLGYTNVRHLAGGMDSWVRSGQKLLDLKDLESEVLPKNGIELPVPWNNLGPRLINLGVIDEAKFKTAVKLTPEQEQILTQGSDQKIRIDASNSQFVVDMLWAIGLAQKSDVYDNGPMGKEYRKDAGNFSSTGGWSLSRTKAMDYLNRFDLIKLSQEQQKQVSEISQNIYRPCCGNSTWFPDCNHGMAVLAIVEMLVANNIPEDQIYRLVLGFNSFWFPDSYLTVATQFARKGITWKEVDSKLVLGKDYSSSQGAANVKKQVGPLPYKAEFASSCGT